MLGIKNEFSTSFPELGGVKRNLGNALKKGGEKIKYPIKSNYICGRIHLICIDK